MTHNDYEQCMWTAYKANAMAMLANIRVLKLQGKTNNELKRLIGEYNLLAKLLNDEEAKGKTFHTNRWETLPCEELYENRKKMRELVEQREIDGVNIDMELRALDDLNQEPHTN